MENREDDAVKISPDIHKIILENEKVRVLDVILPPGSKANTHSHPASLIYVLEGGWVQIQNQGVEPKKIEFKKGAVVFREETTHSVENAGNTMIHVLHIEPKS